MTEMTMTLKDVHRIKAIHADSVLLLVAEEINAKISLVSSEHDYTQLEWCAIDTYNAAMAEAKAIVRSHLSPECQH